MMKAEYPPPAARLFRERLDFSRLSGMIRRYESLKLLDQSVFTLDHPHSRLARSYRRLLRTLLKDNPADRDGVMMFLDHPHRVLFPRDENEARELQQLAINHLHEIVPLQ